MTYRTHGLDERAAAHQRQLEREAEERRIRSRLRMRYFAINPDATDREWEAELPVLPDTLRDERMRLAIREIATNLEDGEPEADADPYGFSSALGRR